MLRRDNKSAGLGWSLLLAAGALLLCWPVTAANAADGGEAAPEAAVELPAGDIAGLVTEPGGLAHADVPVALVPADAGLEAISTTTGPDGAYVLENVPLGTYTLVVGKPGLAVALQTTEGADSASLNVIIPALLLAPAPAGVPEGVTTGPAAAVPVVGEGDVTLVAAPLTYAEAAGGDATDATKPPKPPHPGKPKPPYPPGRPPDKPLPPPFVSPTLP